MKSEAKGLEHSDIVDRLVELGSKLGYTAVRDYEIPIGKVDVVWLDRKLGEIGIDCPIVGFEVEAADKIRKAYKGSVQNLTALYPQVGVIVLSRRIVDQFVKRRGYDAEGAEQAFRDLKRRVQEYAKFANVTIHVFDDGDVLRMLKASG